MSSSGSQDSNRTGMIFLIVSMGLTFLLFIYVVFVHKHPSPDHVANMPKAPVTVEQAVPPAAPGAATGEPEPVDPTPWVSTSEKIAWGQKVFNVNCALCHGQGGLGDGPAGVNLSPRPRNMTQDSGWKNGNSPFGIHKTISEGLKGTSMAPYPSMPEKDKWALAAFVRSLNPNIKPVSEADIKKYLKTVKK